MPDGAEARVLDVDECPAGDGLWILERGGDVVDGAGGHAARVEQGEPLVRAALEEQFVQDGEEFVAVAMAVGEGGIALGELGALGGVAEAPPEST